MQNEKKVERYLVEQCKQRDFKCIKQAPTLKGLPDRLIITRGEMFFIELKDPNGVVSEAQKLVHADFRERGVDVYICSTREEIDAILDLYDL